MENDKLTVRTSLRLPVDLHRKLHEAAGLKTMHAEILERLEKSFQDDAGSAVTERIVEKAVRKVLAETRGADNGKNGGP